MCRKQVRRGLRADATPMRPRVCHCKSDLFVYLVLKCCSIYLYIILRFYNKILHYTIIFGLLIWRALYVQFVDFRNKGLTLLTKSEACPLRNIDWSLLYLISGVS